jgi:hypothetical protein
MAFALRAVARQAGRLGEASMPVIRAIREIHGCRLDRILCVKNIDTKAV